MMRHTYRTEQLLVWLALLVASLFLIGVVDRAPRVAFVSPEVKFTDSSAGGMQIMPASCASNPAFYHQILAYSSDQKGLTSHAGETTQYGATLYGVHVCVENASGRSFFIPANSAAELNSFKNRSTPISGVQSW